MTVMIGVAARNAACDAIVDLVDGGSGAGHLFVRSGSAPATPATGDSGTELADITLQDPAFDIAGSGGGNADGETILLGVPLSDTNAVGGTAGHFRIKDSNSVVILQGSCGQGSGDLSFDNATIVTGGTVTVTSLTVTVPAS
jgi:hypothetical protein